MASHSVQIETPSTSESGISNVDIERGSPGISVMNIGQREENADQNKLDGKFTQFLAKRWRVTAIVSMVAFLQSVILGSSALIDALSVHFNSPNCNYCYHGVFAIVLALPVANTLAGQLIRLFKARPQLQVPVCAVGVLFVPAGFFCTSIAVVLGNNVVLLYIGMTVLLGLGLGTLELVNMYWGLLWWSVDGKKSTGVGILGGATGIGAIFWTLVTGWLVTGLSLETTLCVEGILAFAIAAPITWAVCCGYCGSPPSEEDVRAWMFDAGVIKQAATHSKSDTADDNARAIAAGLRPAGTTVLMPVVCQSTWELFSYPVTSMLLFSGSCLSFVGYATKTLLSIMFSDMFGVSEGVAAYLAAASLVLFAFGRFAVPYFVMDNPHLGISALGIRIAAQVVTGIVYALLPFITGDGSSSWNVVGFVIAKSVAGLAFAVGAVVGGALGVQLFGTANMHLIMVPGWFLFGIGGALGPIVAYTIAATRVEGGMGYAEAYSLYFYLAAGIALVSAAVTVAMYLMEKRALRTESLKLASKA